MSKIDGSRSIRANTRLEAASPLWSWFSSIPRMNIGIVMRVEMSKNVTNCPTEISSVRMSQPPAETSSPNEIPATT